MMQRRPERTYKCRWCLDTGCVGGIIEVEIAEKDVYRHSLHPCLQCEMGRATRSAGPKPGCRIVKIYNTLCGAFEDPDDPMGYRSSPAPDSAWAKAATVPASPRVSGRPRAGAETACPATQGARGVETVVRDSESF